MVNFMAKKHLSKADIKSLSDMLKTGKTNAEVAEHFNVSLATVNNHRTRLKREGMSFPSKRGRKPKSAVHADATSPIVSGKSKPDKGAQKSGKAEKISTAVPMEQYDFVINGVKVRVSGKAKDVHIGKAAMVINF